MAGQAILEMSGRLLLAFIRGETGPFECVENPLPADARVVDCRPDFMTPDTILFRLESGTFPDSPEGSILHRLPFPVFRSIVPVKPPPPPPPAPPER